MTSSTAFNTPEAMRQAPSSSPRSSSPVKTGMNDEASAPPETRVKTKSGMAMAVVKAAASWPEAPSTLAWMETRARPSRRLSTNPAMRIAAAAAILVPRRACAASVATTSRIQPL